MATACQDLRGPKGRGFKLLVSNCLLLCLLLLFNSGWTLYGHSHVLDGAAEGVRDDALLDVLLAQSKVRQLDVALRVQQNILWLQVPIDYS